MQQSSRGAALSAFLSLAGLILMCVMFVSFTGRATDPGYTNVANMDCSTPPPQIDAAVFVNQGTFCGNTTPTGIGLGQFFSFGGLSVGLVNPGLSYSTMNTLSFTNNGIMTGSPGFELDYVTDDGFHHPAASIVNSSGGANGPATITGGTYVLLSATNLVNRGLLEIGPFGLMQLSGFHKVIVCRPYLRGQKQEGHAENENCADELARVTRHAASFPVHKILNLYG